MNDGKNRLWLWSAGALLCVAGLIYSYGTFNGLIEGKRRLEKKAGDLKVLQAIAEDIQRYRDAKRQYEALPGKKVVPISDVVSASAVSNRVADTREMRAKIGGGWSLVQKELVLNEVSIKDTVEFVRKAESVRPPWWLKKIVIRSSARDAGTGQIVLTMEVLEQGGRDI